MTVIRKVASLVAGSAFCLGLGSGVALASGPVEVTPEPIVVAPAPAVTDWSGFYGGLSYSAIGGQITRTPAPLTAPIIGTAGPGIFMGYNVQRGHFVYGGELNYMRFTGRFTGFVNTQDNSLELRLRGGYAVRNVLLYGFVGPARSSLFGLGINNNQSGYSYGLGIQAALPHNTFVGFELSQRVVSGPLGAFTIESTINAASLRFGYRF